MTGTAMKRTIFLAMALVAASPTVLAGQTTAAPKWEYGRLLTTWGVPALWTGTGATALIDEAKVQKVLELNRAGYTPPADPIPLQMALNQLGNEGWELVFVSNQGNEREFLFKRRKP